VPDAVPAVSATPQVPKRLIAPELSPDGMAPPLEHGALLAVGSYGVGLSPPGESEVAPNGIPTGPTGEVAPGTPRGDVGPIAEPFGVSGASWAKLAPQPRSSIADAVNSARNNPSVQCRPQMGNHGIAARLILRCCFGSCASWNRPQHICSAPLRGFTCS
jgi:hypothetical protein